MATNRGVLKTIELFAGAGGLGIGFLLADHPRFSFEPLFAVDADKDAVSTYQRNMKWLSENAPNILPRAPKIYQKNVESLKARSINRLYNLAQCELDLLIGGPPCQGYSPSNRQTTKEKKSHLNNMVKVFMDCVSDFRPKMFLIENVQGVQWTKPTKEMEIERGQLALLPTVSADASDVRDYIKYRSTSLGYRVWHSIIDAADYGVPQRRMRFFVFGIRDDLTDNADISLTSYLARKRTAEPTTVDTAISDLPPIGNGQKWTGNDYQASSNLYVTYLRRYLTDGVLYDHDATNHQPYVIERFRHIGEGQNWSAARHLMSTYTDVDRTHSNIYKRLVGNMPAHTISHYRKSMTIHPRQHRGLSFREACRLQSFPDWYRFEGGSDSAQQQLANAVPPLLASVVAWSIAELWANIVDRQEIKPIRAVG